MVSATSGFPLSDALNEPLARSGSRDPGGVLSQLRASVRVSAERNEAASTALDVKPSHSSVLSCETSASPTPRPHASLPPAPRAQSGGGAVHVFALLGNAQANAQAARYFSKTGVPPCFCGGLYAECACRADCAAMRSSSGPLLALLVRTCTPRQRRSSTCGDRSSKRASRAVSKSTSMQTAESRSSDDWQSALSEQQLPEP